MRIGGIAEALGNALVHKIGGLRAVTIRRP